MDEMLEKAEAETVLRSLEAIQGAVGDPFLGHDPLHCSAAADWLEEQGVDGAVFRKIGEAMRRGREPGLGRILRIVKVVNDGGMEGYGISTVTSTVSVLINNTQCCWEDWGYVCSEDDVDAFVGSSLLYVEVTDENLCSTKIPTMYDGGTVFVNLYTTKGKLQFAVYNLHDGLYGHNVKVSVGDRTLCEHFI